MQVRDKNLELPCVITATRVTDKPYFVLFEIFQEKQWHNLDIDAITNKVKKVTALSFD